MATFCLTVHAAYACRHTGACCSAPWRIPVERATLPLLRRHGEIAEILDRSHDESDMAASLRTSADCTGANTHPAVPRRDDGTCMFFESHNGRLCTIHRVAGPELLPSACRHFPRVVLKDPRGAFVTLSSFCPTAAALLQQYVPLRIVEAPRSLVPPGTLEGLDATTVLPPLLREGVLVDYEGYSAWERAAIAVLERDDLQVDVAIDLIAGATARVRQWQPDSGILADHIATSFSAVPPPGEPTYAGERPLRMFAAAHLFGSWAAYQNGGIMAIVDAVRHALSRLEWQMASGMTFIEAARATDLALRHTEEDGTVHGGA